jgi:NADH:ubiquinone reductase (H+-translocating)
MLRPWNPGEHIYKQNGSPEGPLQESSTSAKVPRVVIVGGGFGGFYAARALAKAPVQITLIDKRNYHLFRPMLYQVATGLLSADEIAPPLRVVFSRQKNVDVVLSEVTGVDTVNRRVLLPACDLPYDYLILATGWMMRIRFAPGS